VIDACAHSILGAAVARYDRCHRRGRTCCAAALFVLRTNPRDLLALFATAAERLFTNLDLKIFRRKRMVPFGGISKRTEKGQEKRLPLLESFES